MSDINEPKPIVYWKFLIGLTLDEARSIIAKDEFTIRVVKVKTEGCETPYRTTGDIVRSRLNVAIKDGKVSDVYGLQ